MAGLLSKIKTRLRSKSGIDQTLDNSTTIDKKSRADASHEIQKNAKAVPFWVGASVGVAAVRNSWNNHKIDNYQKELRQLDKKFKRDQTSRVGGGNGQQFGDAFSDRFNAIMKNFEEENLQDKLAKCQKRKAKWDRFGQQLNDMIHSVGQAATINSRKDALATLKGRSSGASRDDVVARYGVIDDADFTTGNDGSEVVLGG